MQLQGKWEVKQFVKQPLIVVNSIVHINCILNKTAKFAVLIADIIMVKILKRNGMVDMFMMTWKFAGVKEREQIPDFQTGNLFQKTKNNGW